MTNSKRIVLTFLLSLFLSTSLFSQEKKVYETIRVSSPPKIDGVLDDPQWKNAQIAKDFIVYNPDNGREAYQKTEAKVVYNDKALFIGAMMYENDPDSISEYLTPRDQMGISDYFGIQLNPYNDGQSFIRIFVTSAGVQWDVNGSKDWNIVYKTAVQVTDSGWIAEMEIPYSALRFPKTQNQDWAFNFIRGHAMRGGESSWNYLNNEIPNQGTQLGLLRGLKDVDPPIRFSLSPYFSTYLNHNGETNSWGKNIKGGVDLKYGINESFTLDMMLIPDFGQVQSDDITQNLSPFETYYSEKRQFFTEGQELFGRADLFYSRRIGSTPRNMYEAEENLAENEIVSENPSKAKLINATKISGKTKNGLSIGFLNAMTKTMDAVIKDTITGIERNFRTQSFTNYNVTVLEQALKNNSYISLINTNVITPNEDFSANVTATEFKFYDKNTNYNLSGHAAYSRVKENSTLDPLTGFKYRIRIGKESGNFRFGLSRRVVSENYQQNDLGYANRNNYINHNLSLNYNILQPTWIIKNWNFEVSAEHASLYKPQKFTSSMLFFYTGGRFINDYQFGNYILFSPTESHDYYEARVEGRVYNKSKRFEIGGHFTSDNKKRFVYRHRYEYEKFSEKGTSRFEIDFDPSFRINNKFSLDYSFRLEKINNNFGYITDDIDTGEITFGRRDRKIITNQISLNYIFSNKASLSFRLRHYLSTAKYDKFYDLNINGDLNPIDYSSSDHDMTFNTLNIDFAYKWQFAPGSELSLVWKNAIASYLEGEYLCNYVDNVNNLFNSPQFNSLSLKILYYLDWQYLKKVKKK